MPTSYVVFLIVAFIAWQTWYHFKQWKESKAVTTPLLLMGIVPFIVGADAPDPPRKVETSVGIYDVQSKDDLLNFSAEEIRELVKIEDDRIQGRARLPHPILVYCFEEHSFHYTGGRYDNAEIKYRLRVPQQIVLGKKYPLVVHLHGVGEAGTDNIRSLAHLHSILPLIVGPEQQDFFMLVLQCPQDNRNWTFRLRKDGNLDVLVAAIDHVIENNSIDESRLSTFGLSSGGNGVWRLIDAYPEKFAAAVPASCSARLDSNIMPLLKSTPIWIFNNRNDRTIDSNSVHKAMEIVNGSGGFMKLTEFDQGGHAAWRNAMGEYNCFAWMIAQKRGGWFKPPPDRVPYQGRSLSNCFFAFFLPLGLAVGLLIFQQSSYSRHSHDEESDESKPSADEFRTWTDTTGTKQVNAKVIGFQGDGNVRIQLSEGKVMTAKIKQFCDADQQLMLQMRSQMLVTESFREWADRTGKHTTTAKFTGFQSDNVVLLQSKTGKTMPVPIDRLGQAEREFLKHLKNRD